MGSGSWVSWALGPGSPELRWLKGIPGSRTAKQGEKTTNTMCIHFLHCLAVLGAKALVSWVSCALGSGSPGLRWLEGIPGSSGTWLISPWYTAIRLNSADRLSYLMQSDIDILNNEADKAFGVFDEVF